ncbi:MAG: O-antigen ligase family protein [Clostridia bacterium]|nr:O-antigen ligase family protein [Clostridia bacterium]
MLENSIAFSLLKKIWHLLKTSVLFNFFLSILDFFVGSFRESCFKKVLLKIGDLGGYVEDSVFYRVLSAFIGFFVNIAVKISNLFIDMSKTSLVGKLYKKAFWDSLIFGYKTLFPFLAAAIFLVPHDFWANMFGLFIALLLCVLYIIAAAYEKKDDFANSVKKIPFSMIFFAFAILLAVVTSHDVGDSVRVLFFFITSFLLCFAVYGRLNSREMVDTFMRTVYFALLVMSVFGIVQRIMGVEANASLTDLELNKNMPGRVFGTLDNPNNFAEYLTIFMPYGFAYAITRKDASSKFLHTVCMILPMASILLTYSRSGWIALAAAVIVYIALYNYRLFPAVFVGGVFVMPFIPQSIYERILTIGNLSDSSSSYRMDIWTGCFEMLKKYWFTGVGLGPGGFAKVFPDYAVGETTVVMHSHMQFMEMMVEGGILLFVAYIALVFGLIRRACVSVGQAKDCEMKHYAAASCASLAGITLIGLFEYCWFYPRVMFAFFISAGICLALSRLVGTKD